MARSQADLNRRASERAAASNRVKAQKKNQSLVDRAYGFAGAAKRAMGQFNVFGTAAKRIKNSK